MGLVQYVWGTERPSVRLRRVDNANRMAEQLEAKAEEVRKQMLADAAEIRRRVELEKRQVEFLPPGGKRYDRRREAELTAQGIVLDSPARRGRGRPRKHFAPLPSPSPNAPAARRRSRKQASAASRSPIRQPVQCPSAAPLVGDALMGTTSLVKPKKPKTWQCPHDLSDPMNPPEALRAVFPYVGLPTEFEPEAMSEEQRMAWLKAVFRRKEGEFVERNVKRYHGSAGFRKEAAREIQAAMAEEKTRIKMWSEISRRTGHLENCLKDHENGKMDREDLYDRVAENDYLQLTHMLPEEQKMFEDALYAMDWPEGLSRRELIARAGRDPDKFEPVGWGDRRRVIPLWRETGYGIHGLTPEEEVERLRQLAERGRSVQAPDGTVMAPQEYLAFLAAAGPVAIGMTRDAFQAFITERNSEGAEAASTDEGPLSCRVGT